MASFTLSGSEGTTTAPTQRTARRRLTGRVLTDTDVVKEIKQKEEEKKDKEERKAQRKAELAKKREEKDQKEKEKKRKKEEKQAEAKRKLAEKEERKRKRQEQLEARNKRRGEDKENQSQSAPDKGPSVNDIASLDISLLEAHFDSFKLATRQVFHRLPIRLLDPPHLDPLFLCNLGVSHNACPGSPRTVELRDPQRNPPSLIAPDPPLLIPPPWLKGVSL
ncbi:hypothetical protein Bbelb_272610 [Branchiostoma belcheri]|nr:hypothetical protein Bbelb_272610 [Branchiostoma belcheri]